MSRLKIALAAAVLLLSVLGSWQFYVVFGSASWREVFALLGTIPAPVWLQLAALTALFYLLDWVRFRSVLAVLGHRLRWIDGLQLTCVSYFVTSLTPMAELHTPAMVLMLQRLNVPTPQALAASLTKSIYMTLWICAVSYACLLFDHSIRLAPALRLALPVLSLPLLAIAVPLALIAFFPQRVLARTQAWGAALQSRIARGAPAGQPLAGSGVTPARHANQPASHAHAPVPSPVRWRRACLIALRKLVLGLGHSAASIAQIGQSGQLQHLICHLASITFLLVYVTIGWLMAAYFGFSLHFWQALTIFSTSLMVAYLAPLPGAIGVTEIATAYMLDPALGPQAMAAALVLRILCWYLVGPPGALVLLHVLRSGTWRWPTLFRDGD